MSIGTRRREARERALSLLYEAETKDESSAAVLAALAVVPESFVVELVTGVGEEREEIDRSITASSDNWRLDRMPAIDRALLRLGVYELGWRHDVPTGVVISEAVELAKRFSTEDSGRFVHGVLARVAREVRGDGDVPPVAEIIEDLGDDEPDDTMPDDDVMPDDTMPDDTMPDDEVRDDS